MGAERTGSGEEPGTGDGTEGGTSTVEAFQAREGEALSYCEGGVI